MVRVVATGVFDLLHIGHVHFLEEARKHGDELWVVVACDETVVASKHTPIMPEDMRRELVEALKPVDKAVVGHSGERYSIMEEIKPDIIVIGYDQPYNESKIEEAMAKRGLEVKVVRLGHFDSDLGGTRKIIRYIEDRLGTEGFYKNGINGVEDEEDRHS